MKAGDAKRFLEKAISSEKRSSLNPKDFNINDNFILNLVSAYQNGESPEFIEKLVGGFITTEMLTVRRRVAVLRLMRDVFSELSKSNTTPEDRQRLRSLITAYYI